MLHYVIKDREKDGKSPDQQMLEKAEAKSSADNPYCIFPFTEEKTSIIIDNVYCVPVSRLINTQELSEINDGLFVNFIHPPRLSLLASANYAIIKGLISIEQAKLLISSEAVQKSFQFYYLAETNWGWDYFSGRLAEFAILGV